MLGVFAASTWLKGLSKKRMSRHFFTATDRVFDNLHKLSIRSRKAAPHSSLAPAPAPASAFVSPTASEGSPSCRRGQPGVSRRSVCLRESGSLATRLRFLLAIVKWERCISPQLDDNYYANWPVMTLVDIFLRRVTFDAGHSSDGGMWATIQLPTPKQERLICDGCPNRQHSKHAVCTANAQPHATIQDSWMYPLVSIESEDRQTGFTLFSITTRASATAPGIQWKIDRVTTQGPRLRTFRAFLCPTI